MTLHSRDEGELEFGRILAFSDGVFAIAITLLVLSIDVPTPPTPARDLPREIADLGPQLFAYFLSFAVVGLMWVRHHRLLASLRAFDGPLMALNLFTLCFVVLLPVPTELLGEYGHVPAGVWPYAACVIVVVLGMAMMFEHACRAGLLREEATPAQLRAARVRTAFTVAVFAISIVLAFVAPKLATLSWLLLALRRWVIRSD